MRFSVNKDGKYMQDVLLDAVSFGTRFQLNGDDIIIWGVYVENRGERLAVDWTAHDQGGHTYRGYAIDLLK